MTDHSQSTSDTMNEESDTQHGIRWGIIFLDLCILLLFSGILMGIAIGIQKAFSVTNDAQALISTNQKGQLIDGKDPVFLQALGQNHNGEAAKLANTPDFSGRTPLMWAAYTHYNNPELTYAKDKIRHYYTTELLAVSGLDAKARDNDGWTALHWASWSGLPSVTSQLIKAGLDINLAEKNGYTPAMLAAMRGNDKSIAFLIEAGADLNAKNKNGQSALDLARLAYTAYLANFDLTKTKVWVPDNPANDADQTETSSSTGKYVDIRGEAFRNTIRLIAQKTGQTPEA